MVIDHFLIYYYIERGDSPDNVESDADDIEKAGMDQDLSKTKVDRDLPKAYTTLEQCLGSPGSPQPPTSLYWVRMSSIRNHDNEAFSNALSEPQARLRCVFIIDPWYMCAQGKKKLGLNRYGSYFQLHNSRKGQIAGLILIREGSHFELLGLNTYFELRIS